MKHRADVSDARLWEIVTATVRPLRAHAQPRPIARAAPPAPALPPGTPLTRRVVHPVIVAPKAPHPARPRPAVEAARPPEAIEPGRRRRLQRGRDETADRIDLHGLNQDQARAALTAFALRAWAEHQRHILVITGKGALGDGVLRRRVPEWLAEPPLRAIVAGLSEAHRRHGGEGALYVALKRLERR